MDSKDHYKEAEDSLSLAWESVRGVNLTSTNQSMLALLDAITHALLCLAVEMGKLNRIIGESTGRRLPNIRE